MGSVEAVSDGAILDRLKAALLREGPTERLKDSVPVDLWRRALRRVRP